MARCAARSCALSERALPAAMLTSKLGSSFESAPPSRASTMPVRMMTTRTPSGTWR